jgi:hypothetical protein
MIQSPPGMTPTIVIRLATCPLRLWGPYGCEWIETPNLDRLAASGQVFDSHFVTGMIGQDYYVENAISFDDFSDSHLERESIEIAWDPFDDWEFDDIRLDDESSRTDFFKDLKEAMEAFDRECEILVALREQATIILTANRGLPLGEHGIFGTTGSRLHDEYVRIPLIVSRPDQSHAGSRVHQFSSSETVEALKHNRSPVEQDLIITRSDTETAIRTSDACLLWPHTGSDSLPLLFEIPNDRFEVNNLFDRQPDRVEELKSRFRDTLSR